MSRQDIQMFPMPDKHKDYEEWLAIRKGTIGGSEASCVTGLNPYKSAFALACEMTGRTKPFEGNLATEVGDCLEDFVAKKFEAKTGLSVKRSNYLYRNKNYPSQHALPDRLCYWRKGADDRLKGLKVGLEIKTTSAFCKLKKDAFPEQYYCQCVQYLSVMEYDIWFLCVLVGNRELHIYELRHDESYPVPDWVEGELVVGDDEYFALRDACNEFMAMVQMDQLPAPDGSESSTSALAEAFPKSKDGSKTWIEDTSLVENHIRLKNDIKLLEKEDDEIVNKLKAQMGEYETAGCGAYTISWKSSTRNTFDSKRFKAEHPDIYEQYMKNGTVRTFSVI